MTTMHDVRRLVDAANIITRSAVGDVEALVAGIDLSDPAAARDTLAAAVPELVREHADAAGALGADWYDETRAANVTDDGYRASLGARKPDAAVESSVRSLSGALWSDDPEAVINALRGAVQRHVMTGVRRAVLESAARDPRKPRFARVPVGDTCAWCVMLASQGYVYVSRASAGESDAFHDDCDCQIVPEWDRTVQRMDGYDPDEYLRIYKKAYEAAGTSRRSEVLKAMRRQGDNMIADSAKTD